MSFNSGQEIFTLVPYPIGGSNGYFGNHLHFYVGNGSIKFGVFNANGSEIQLLPSQEYKTVLSELTLRKNIKLVFGSTKVNVTNDYKLHIAAQVLERNTNPIPSSNWPGYKPTAMHICEKAKATNPSINSIGRIMCAKPVLIYDQTTSRSTVLSFLSDFVERPDDSNRINFNNYQFIVCYGPYNNIILCAIPLNVKNLVSDYISEIKNFSSSLNSYLAIGLNDVGIPSDHMEVNVHFKHTLYEVVPNPPNPSTATELLVIE